MTPSASAVAMRAPSSSAVGEPAVRRGARRGRGSTSRSGSRACRGRPPSSPARWRTACACAARSAASGRARCAPRWIVKAVDVQLARRPSTTLAAEADREQVARAHLGPVRPVAVEQEAVVATGDDEAEVVVDALVEAVEGRGAQRGRRARRVRRAVRKPRWRSRAMQTPGSSYAPEAGVSFRPRAGARGARSRGARPASRAPP